MSSGYEVTAFTVFALGLRHGADPDHIAAIDNMTRNTSQEQPIAARFVGTLFAGGHSMMVIAMAAIVGLLGAHFSAHAALVETIGTWVSIVVLIMIAVLNLRQLQSDPAGGLAGVRTRMLPRALRTARSPLVAIPVGLLFGIGFETSSQVAAYSLAFANSLGAFGAVLVGVTFCAGMTCTDTLDSVLVHRLVSDRSARLPAIMRLWIWSVTILAVLVAAYEFAQLMGWRSPMSDLAVSMGLVAALLLIFGIVFVATRPKLSSISNPSRP